MENEFNLEYIIQKLNKLTGKDFSYLRSGYSCHSFTSGPFLVKDTDYEEYCANRLQFIDMEKIDLTIMRVKYSMDMPKDSVQVVTKDIKEKPTSKPKQVKQQANTSWLIDDFL